MNSGVIILNQLAHEKTLRFPDVRQIIFFGCGFFIGFVAPTYIWGFLDSTNDFITSKIKGLLGGGELSESAGIDEGDPALFLMIAMVAGLLTFISKMLIFVWGILFGFFLRTVLISMNVTTPDDFLGNITLGL